MNVGGDSTIRMADLVRVIEGLGLSDPRTLLASGNVVFGGRVSSPAALEHRLEAALAEQLGLTSDCFVRSTADWEAAIAANPFPREATEDPAHLLVAALKSEPSEGVEARVRAATVGRERVRVIGRQAYLVYPDGIGRSKLTPAVLDKALGVRSTARNWNTVGKLATLLRA